MISYNPVELLAQLISIESLSRKEEDAAAFISNVLVENGIGIERIQNNVFAKNKHFKEGKYAILLNSHLDTVKPNLGYTLHPFTPVVKDGKLFGLGSNDAGGALICLLGTFLHYFDKKDLPFNLIFAASAEEEISGKNGMESLFPNLGKIDFAIVGEPTLMQIATAERGLMVLDVEVAGKSGHAARNEGVNAIYEALNVINWFKSFQFEKISPELGPVSMTVTGIEAGTQHNVVPDLCKFMVDIRVNELYSNQEILNTITKSVSAKVKARSTRLNSSGVNKNHPIRKVANTLNIKTYGSPTMSDQALMSCESIKMGPGDSARSHTADEFIFIEELENAIAQYIKVLDALGKELS